MELSSKTRDTLAYTLGGLAVALRMASDWLFPGGGPLEYQLLQAAFLALAVIGLWPNLGAIYLRGGQNLRSVAAGLIAFPVGLVLGIGMVWLRFGALQWPRTSQVIGPIANNVFFTAVEEIEFRGFLLSFLMRVGMRPTSALWLQAIVHTFAHIHRFWQGDYLSPGATLAVTLCFGLITLRTRSLWGAWVAHLSWNIGLLLPEIGAGLYIR